MMTATTALKSTMRGASGPAGIAARNLVRSSRNLHNSNSRSTTSTLSCANLKEHNTHVAYREDPKLTAYYRED